jgi:hypothetical protein
MRAVAQNRARTACSHGLILIAGDEQQRRVIAQPSVPRDARLPLPAGEIATTARNL